MNTPNNRPEITPEEVSKYVEQCHEETDAAIRIALTEKVNQMIQRHDGGPEDPVRVHEILIFASELVHSAVILSTQATEKVMKGSEDVPGQDSLGTSAREKAVSWLQATLADLGTRLQQNLQTSLVAAVKYEGE